MGDQDICEEYRSSLMDLTFNSKPLISMLTMLAEDNLQHAPKIVQVIEWYLQKADPEVKLPVMYLIDSIIKNVGSTYLNLFIQNIVSNFCAVFEKVDEKTRAQLFKLRQTWNDIFPSKKLYAIDVRVSQIDPAWPVTAEKPAQQSIHINPRFLENKPKVIDDKESQQAQVRQQLLAKQQELIRLQQQKLELEILQTKAKLEQSRLNQPMEQPIAISDPRILRRDPRLVAATRDPRLVKTKPAVPSEVIVKQPEPEMSLPSVVMLPKAVEPKPIIVEPKQVVPKVEPKLVEPRPLQPAPVMEFKPAAPNKSAVIVTLVPASHATVPPVTTLATPSVQSLEPRISPNREVSGTEDKKTIDKKSSAKPKFSPKKNSEVKRESKRSVSPKDRAKLLDTVNKETKETAGEVRRSEKESKEPVKSEKVSSISETRDSSRITSNVASSNDSVASPSRAKTRKDSSPPKASTRTKRDRYSSRGRNSGKVSESKDPPGKSRHKRDKSSDSRERSRSPVKRNEKSQSKSGDSKASKDTTHESKDSSSPRQAKGCSPKKSASQKSSGTSNTDIDLRMYTPSADSCENNAIESRSTSGKNDTKSSKGKTSRDEESRDIENEPPYKKQKEDTDLQSLFGAEDQDYRHLPQNQLVVKSPGQKGWAQYKEALSEGIRKASEQVKEKKGSRDSEDRDFRPPQRGDRYQNSGPGGRGRSFRGSGNDARNRRFDRLGRPLLSKMTPFESRSFNRRGGFGRQYDRSGGPRKFDHYPKTQMQLELMLSHQDQIIREAEEQLQAGIITKEQHCHLMQQLEQLNAMQRIQGRRALRGSPHMDDPLIRADDFRGRRPPADIGSKVADTPDPKYDASKIDLYGGKGVRDDLIGFRPSSPPTILVDGQLRRIEFWEGSAIVLMGKDDPREMMFIGSPRKVFIDDMAPITVSFGGEEKEFIMNGKRHTVKFGCPLREVIVDGCPYQAHFGGPPIHILVDSEPHILRLEGPAPKLSIGEHSRKDLLEPLFLSKMSDGEDEGAPAEGNANVTSSPLDSNAAVVKTEPEPVESSVPEGKNQTESAESKASEAAPSDIDMREAKKLESQEKDEGPVNAQEDAGGMKPSEPAEKLGGLKDMDWRAVPRSEPDQHLPVVDKQFENLRNSPLRSSPLRNSPLRNSPHHGDHMPPGGQPYLGHPESRNSPQHPDWDRTMEGEKRLHMLAQMQREAETNRRMHMMRREDWPNQQPDVWEKDTRNKFMKEGPFSVGMDGPGWRSNDFPDRGGEMFRQSEHMPERGPPPHFMEQRPLMHPHGRGPNVNFPDDRQMWDWHMGEFREFNAHPVHGPRPSGVFPQGQGSPHHHDEPFARDRPHPMDHNSARNMFNRGPLPPPPAPPQFMMQQTLRPQRDIPAYVSREVFFQGPGIPDGQQNMDIRPAGMLGGPPFGQHPMVNQMGGALPGQPMPMTDAPSLQAPSNAQQPFVPLLNLDVNSLFSKLVAAGLIKGEQSEDNSGATKTIESEETKTSDKKSQEMPVVELKSESLKKRYPEVISALYQGTQCASCGLRFLEDQQEKYSQHLDWHFRVNRREKDGVKKAFSRKWFYDVEDWIQFEEIEDLEERTQSFFEIQASAEQYHVPSPTAVQSVPASSEAHENVCVVCGEPFELFWVEEEEEWHLKDALRVGESRYHPLCYEDYKKSLEVTETSTASAIPGLENLEEVAPAESPIEEKPAEMELLVKIKEEIEEPMQMEEEENKVSESEMLKDVEDALETLIENVVQLELEERREQERLAEEVIQVNEVPLEELIPITNSEEADEAQTEGNLDEPQEEPKMVVIQSGGITLKVKAASIAMPASPSVPLESSTSNPADESESEDEFRPPTPDPRFKVLPPVQRGTELSGLCSIM